MVIGQTSNPLVGIHHQVKVLAHNNDVKQNHESSPHISITKEQLDVTATTEMRNYDEQDVYGFSLL